MQTGNLEFVLAWVSIIGTVSAAFTFLYRGTRRGFDRQDEKTDKLGTDVTALRVSVARIEGHLGIGFPVTPGEQRAAGAPPAIAPPHPTTQPEAAVQ